MTLALLTHDMVDEDFAGYILHTTKPGPAGNGQIDSFVKLTAQQLFESMALHNISQVWIAPGAFPVEHDEHGLTFVKTTIAGQPRCWSFIHDDMGGWQFKRYGEGHLSSVHGYLPGGTAAQRKLRSVIWPEFTAWEWEEPLDDPLIMLGGIERLQKVLSIDLSSSPGVTGRKFAVACLEQRNQHHWLSSVTELADVPCKAGVADVAWKRDLGEDLVMVMQHIYAELKISQEVPLYVHCIDKNSMYASACTALPLGVGNPVHVGPEEFAGVIPKLNGAGIYQIAVLRSPDSDLEPFDGLRAPEALYGSVEKENRQEWVSAPLLKLLYDQGYEIAIRQAWVWSQSRRILEVPACQLWELRQALKQETQELGSFAAECSQFAYDAMKVIMTSWIGLLASEHTTDRRYFRPDIWRAVIECAKARMFYNMQAIFFEKGLLPIACLTDALWYISPEPDPQKALGKALDRPNSLGGFKVEYSLSLDYDVTRALSEAMVTGMARALGEIAERQQRAAREYYDYTENDYSDDEDENEDFIYPDEEEEDENEDFIYPDEEEEEAE